MADAAKRENDAQGKPGTGSAAPGWHPLAQWAALALLSALLVALLEFARLPAAFLIGPMIAGATVGICGASIRVIPRGFFFAQAIVGSAVAAGLSPSSFAAFAASWPVFAAAVLSTVAASSFLGWLISRLHIMPGTTGVWGSSPGAAGAMVLMAGAFGADQRLVAFMQYLRVVFVSIGAALIARIWVDPSAVEGSRHDWFPVIQWLPFATTICVAAAGAGAAYLLRLPAPAFVGAFVLTGLLHLGFSVEFQMPEWLLSGSYVVVGWAIGLRFDRVVTVHALRALPQLVLSIIVLMGFCGAIAWVLAHELGIDPLTAYLATSPGGMETVAIVAASSPGVDISFIMTLQAMRFLFLVLFGAPIARLVARWVKDT